MSIADHLKETQKRFEFLYFISIEGDVKQKSAKPPYEKSAKYSTEKPAKTTGSSGKRKGGKGPLAPILEDATARSQKKRTGNIDIFTER